jgi:hypothetical protein
MEKEQGKVNWINDYETGLNRSETEKKPMLLDFFKEG